MVNEIGCPYISAARATMLRKALDAKADVIVFIDHDVSWRPADLLKLIQTEGDVVAGTYRFKKDEIEYMGALIPDYRGIPQAREDGALKAHSIPAGFLKVTASGISKFMEQYLNCAGGRITLEALTCLTTASSMASGSAKTTLLLNAGARNAAISG